MSDAEDSERYEGQILCLPEDVVEELGYLLDRQTSTSFPDERRKVILGRWINRETNKFYEFTEITYSQLSAKERLLLMARDVILYRVIVRVLRRVQANRTNVPGGTPRYGEVLKDYKDEYQKDELYIRKQYWPSTKTQDEEYPPSIDIEVEVLDVADNSALPGARVYVNGDWVTSTWKDGIIDFTLPNLDEDADPYEIQVKIAGYVDSDIQEADDTADLTFLMEAE